MNERTKATQPLSSGLTVHINLSFEAMMFAARSSQENLSVQILFYRGTQEYDRSDRLVQCELPSKYRQGI